MDTRRSPALPEVAGFEHDIVETPGLRTHVATIGEGEPVVMLHGFPQHWWQWHEIAPLIADAGYRVICPDLRGAGWTAADDPRIERETRLQDLLAVLEALGIDRFRLVSHDMGAITAMQMTYQHSGRVHAAVQLSVPPGFMTFSPKLLPAMRHLPPLIWHRRGTALDGIFEPPAVVRPMAEQVVATHLAPMQRPEIDRAVRALYRGMVLPEAMRMSRGVYRKQRLAVPTVVAFGRQDHGFPEALVARCCRNPAKYASHIEFAYVDDAAHFITDDAPAAVVDVVLDWFAVVG